MANNGNGARIRFTTAIYHVSPKRSESQRRIAAAEPRIDVLINNAGALFGARKLTPDNWRRHSRPIHNGDFVLTLGLSDSLFAGSPARVVSTASDAHKGYTLDFR